MGHRLRQAGGVLAVAAILAYVGTASVTPVRGFAPWQGNLIWLIAAAFFSGLLLALTNDHAIWLMAIAAVVGVLLFISLWVLIFWLQLARAIPLPELILSDWVLVYFAQRGTLIFFLSILFGMLGVALAMFAQIFLPEHYQP